MPDEPLHQCVSSRVLPGSPVVQRAAPSSTDAAATRSAAAARARSTSAASPRMRPAASRKVPMPAVPCAKPWWVTPAKTEANSRGTVQCTRPSPCCAASATASAQVRSRVRNRASPVCSHSRSWVRPAPAVPWQMSGFDQRSGTRSASSAARSASAGSPRSRPASISAHAVPERPKYRPGNIRGSRSTWRRIRSAAVATAACSGSLGITSCARTRTPSTPAAPCWMLNGSVVAPISPLRHSRPGPSRRWVATRWSTASMSIRPVSSGLAADLPPPVTGL